MTNTSRWVQSFAVILGFVQLSSMAFDNRFMPTILPDFFRETDKQNYWYVAPMFLTASESQWIYDRTSGVFGVAGYYNQRYVQKSLLDLGFPQKMPAPFWDSEVEWSPGGTMQVEGIAVAFERVFANRFSLGVKFQGFSASTYPEFELTADSRRKISPSPEDVRDLETAMLEMGEQCGLSFSPWSASGGIFDLYGRIGVIENYVSKFHKVDIGFRVGASIATTEWLDDRYACATALSGPGGIGFYGMADVNLLLKEGLAFSLVTGLSKSLSATRRRRIPYGEEAQPFGVLHGDVIINPGYTFIFAPTLHLPNIRGKLGLDFGYWVTVHETDSWEDTVASRLVNGVNAVSNTSGGSRESGWRSEYLHIAGKYDFFEDRPGLCVGSLSCDIPIHLFYSERAAKTFRMMLGVEFSF